MNKKLKVIFMVLIVAILVHASIIPANAATVQQKITLSKKSTKTYSKTISNKTKITTKTEKSTKYFRLIKTSKQQVKVVDYFYKGKKYKIRKTVSTVKSTTYSIKDAKSNTYLGTAVQKLVGKQIIKAFKELDYKIVYKPKVSEWGYCDNKNRQITVSSISDYTMIHELGHFVSFVSMRCKNWKPFIKAYYAEKNKCTSLNKQYNIQNYSEYYADSVASYFLYPKKMRLAQPKTYKLIQEDLSNITDANIATAKAILFTLK